MILELSEAERKLLVEVVRNAPLQGNIDTLSSALRILVGILRKLEDVPGTKPSTPV